MTAPLETAAARGEDDEMDDDEPRVTAPVAFVEGATTPAGDARRSTRRAIHTSLGESRLPDTPALPRIRSLDAAELPPGTRLRTLTAHVDRRGWLFEAFRAEWEPDVAGAQVNLSSSAPGALRGTHVHGRHTDYFVLAAGAATVGLQDLRRGSPSFGGTWLVELDAERRGR